MEALNVLSAGLKRLVMDAYGRGEIDAVLAVGGSGGLSIVCDAITWLPVGMPKLMVSSVASGDIRPYIRGRDIMMFNPISDLIGLNCITRAMLSQAMAAMKGMMEHSVALRKEKLTVAVTSFGSTDPLIQNLLSWSQKRACEMIAFHARGVSGGMAMEDLIKEGVFDGVLDVTTTELADYFGQGILPCDETRFDAMVESGLPFVLSTGAIDMVNFAGEKTVPEGFRHTRQFIRHSKNTILMRTTSEENVQMAEFICRKLKSGGNWRMVIPLKGFSVYDAPGRPFYNPEIDGAFIEVIHRRFPKDSRIRYVDANLCDLDFAKAVTSSFEELIEK